MMKKINTLILCSLCMLFFTAVTAQNQTLPKAEMESFRSVAKLKKPSKLDEFKAASNLNKLPEGAVVLWGGPGDANGEFDGGLNDWTTSGLPAAGIWVWEEDADVTEGSFSPDEPIGSPSAANGAAAFDSDFYDNNGEGAGNIGMGTVPAPHNGDLISPTIDLSNNTNVALSFHSYYRRFQSDPFVSYSNDDGATWSDPIVVHDENENPVNVGATDREVLIYLPGAGGTDQFKVRFSFVGDYYFWMVDDVAIIEAPQNDLAIERFFYTPASFAQPESQIDTDTFSFFVQVSNPGISDQTNVVLGAQVRDADLNILWETSSTIDIIHSGVTDSIFDIEGTYVPDMLAIGDFFLTYTIESDSVDQWEFDNIEGDPFVVTEFLYATEDGDNAFESYFTPGGSPPWQIANIYETTDDFGNLTFTANSITFAGTTNAADPLEGKQVDVWLCEISEDIDAGFGNLEDLKFLENPGLTIVAFGQHVYTNEEGEDRVTVELQDFSGGSAVILKPNTRYMALVDYANANTIFHAFNTKIDYLNRLNFLAFNETDGNWFGGFTGGDNLLPLVRLEIDFGVNTIDNLLPESVMSIQPNPVTDQLTLNVDLGEAADASVIISDITGRVVGMYSYDALSTQSIDYNVSTLSNGTYLVRLATEKGARTVKFVVQK